MFDVGFWELALCFVLALLVLGPERLPSVARTLGRWVGRARAFVRQVTDEWEQEVDAAHWREEAERLKREMEQAERRTAADLEADTPSPVNHESTGVHEEPASQDSPSARDSSE